MGGSCQRTADLGDLVTCCSGKGWKMELRCEVEQMEMRRKDGGNNKKQKEVLKKKTFPFLCLEALLDKLLLFRRPYVVALQAFVI